jgi:integrase
MGGGPRARAAPGRSALGLKWSDVDLEKGTLRIRRRLRPKYAHGCGGICGRKPGCPQKKQTRPDTGETKSRASKRMIGLPDPLIALFRTHKQKQGAEREIARQLWFDEGWVFARLDGRQLNLNTDYHEWKALIAEAGLRDARLYDARHTTATVLLILGIPTPTTMAIMGWSSVSMARRYQHLIGSIRQGGLCESLLEEVQADGRPE